MKIRDLLKIKNRPLITIELNETISAAIKKLAEHDRGSIPVCNKKGELVGIVTERDIVRKSFVCSNAVADIRVEEVMTKDVIIGTPEDDLDYAVSVMKQKRIRHLPIIESQKVVGLVSMRDLLDMQLSETKIEIRYAGLLRRRPQRPVV